jgi:hypothetical protein
VEQLLKPALVGVGVFVTQAVEHDSTGTLEKPWARQQLVLRRHRAGGSHLVEEQIVD